MTHTGTQHRKWTNRAVSNNKIIQPINLHFIRDMKHDQPYTRPLMLFSLNTVTHPTIMRQIIQILHVLQFYKLIQALVLFLNVFFFTNNQHTMLFFRNKPVRKAEGTVLRSWRYWWPLQLFSCIHTFFSPKAYFTSLFVNLTLNLSDEDGR